MRSKIFRSVEKWIKGPSLVKILNSTQNFIKDLCDFRQFGKLANNGQLQACESHLKI